ncbi:MAG: hypothetical protein ACKVKG_02245, partial [Alphaproteobacteria bacterium]
DFTNGAKLNLICAPDWGTCAISAHGAATKQERLKITAAMRDRFFGYMNRMYILRRTLQSPARDFTQEVARLYK